MVNHTDIKLRFGQRLRAIRRAKDLSQQDLAEAAKVSQNYLGAIERGKQTPTLVVVERLAVALNMELPDLLSFEAGEISRAQVRKKIDDLLRGADLPRLQLVLRVLRAVLP
jgi:transcriptional regulator with XRE-family HTH domain